MVPDIQELSLQLEVELFVDRNRLRDRQILEERVRPMQINKIANCSSRRVWSDIGRIRALTRSDVFRINKVCVSLTGNAMNSDRLL